MELSKTEREPEEPDEAYIEALHPLEAGPSFVYLTVKRGADLVLSFLGLLLMAPLLLGISAAIKATTKGPAIYRQARVGREGKIFTIYKFRTMVDGADRLEEHLSDELIKEYRKNRKLAEDPRVTKIGEFLRRSSLDELPQLWNIWKGDMTLVGPRPMMPEEIILYGQSYRDYITVKPGLTCLWQITSRHNTVMNARAELDEEYFCRMGLHSDFVILCKTVRTVLSQKGAC